MFIFTFWHFFGVFLDAVSNFHNMIITNQKPELVIRNCQWKCMVIELRDVFYARKGTGIYPGRLGDRYTGLGTQTLAPKNHSSSFAFSVVCQQKIRWRNYFTMHLIISKWLRRKKCGQKTNTMQQKDVAVKEEIVYESVFIYLST